MSLKEQLARKAREAEGQPYAEGFNTAVGVAESRPQPVIEAPVPQAVRDTEPTGDGSKTFFAYIEGMPSSLTVVIDPGLRSKSMNGDVIINPARMIRFNNGLYRTSDPDEIRVLSGYCKPGSGITADREAYLAAVLEPEKLASRKSEQLRRSEDENNRLRARLRELDAQAEV